METKRSEIKKNAQKKIGVKTSKSVNNISVLPNWETVSSAVRSNSNNEILSGYSVYHSYNSSLW